MDLIMVAPGFNPEVMSVANNTAQLNRLLKLVSFMRRKVVGR